MLIIMYRNIKLKYDVSSAFSVGAGDIDSSYIKKVPFNNESIEVFFKVLTLYTTSLKIHNLQKVRGVFVCVCSKLFQPVYINSLYYLHIFLCQDFF